MKKPEFFLEASVAIGDGGERLVRIESNPDDIIFKISTSSLPEQVLIQLTIDADDCTQLIGMLTAIQRHHTGT